MAVGAVVGAVIGAVVGEGLGIGDEVGEASSAVHFAYRVISACTVSVSNLQMLWHSAS